MDSPVRIQLKKNDYLRHKFFRTLNRRKKRLLLQLIEAPEKELRRRLRLKRYEGGKNNNDVRYVTTGGAGYVPPTSNITAKKFIYDLLTGGIPVEETRRKLYDNMSPYGYDSPISRFVHAVHSNTPEIKVPILAPFLGGLVKAGLLTNEGYSPDRDALWAEYLLIPKNKRHSFSKQYNPVVLSKSSFSPTVGKTGNNYFSLSLSPKEKEDLIKDSRDLPIGKNKNSRKLIHLLGEHTVGRGYDDKGEYVSYYDKWDLNPWSLGESDLSLGIGKPVPVYDRIYLDDYYGVESPTHATYLPEIIVSQYSKGKDSGIHIKPENRGKFNALKKRTGKTTEELTHSKNPLTRKRAIFALNARKWNHNK